MIIQNPTHPSTIKNYQITNHQTQNNQHLSFKTLKNHQLLTTNNLDLSFNTTNIITTPLPNNPNLTHSATITIQSNKKIVTTKFTQLLTPNNYNFMLTHYNTNNTLNPTFENNKIIQTNIHFHNNLLTKIKIDSNKKIIITKKSNTLILTHYNTNNSLNTTFDNNNILHVNLNIHIYRTKKIQNMKIQPNNKIIIATKSFTTPPHQNNFTVTHFNENKN